MKKLGFTLIELLVVIAIISIITSIGVANFVTAQKQARDSARKEILGNVQTAFEQDFALNGTYPIDSSAIASTFDNGESPEDPKNAGDYIITWNTASSEYCVCAKLESSSGNADDPTTNSTCSWNAGGSYYCVQNKQ